MKVLITGGASFIGCHVTESLLKYTNHEIILLDRLDPTTTMDRFLTIPEWNSYSGRVKFLWWDLKASFSESVRKQLKGVDLIFHLASSSHVDRSIQDPLLFVMDNVVGTCNLLTWIKDSGDNPKLIHISTDEVLGSANVKSLSGFREESSTFPENPYAASKAGAESLVISFACTYKIRAQILRLTNIIGIKQHPEKFTIKVIRQILRNETVLIHSDPEHRFSSTRYYLDVRDLCEALLKFIDDSNVTELIVKEHGYAYSGIYNISGTTEVNNLYVARRIAILLNKELDYKMVSYDSTRPYFDMRYFLDDSKIRATLNWVPRYDINDSLSYIVEWYKINLDWLEI